MNSQFKGQVQFLEELTNISSTTNDPKGVNLVQKILSKKLNSMGFKVRFIKNKQKLGLVLDNSIFSEFQKKTKSKNYLFSQGIDFIYEFFNFERKINNKILNNSISVIGRNKVLNKSFRILADVGAI